MSFEQLQHVSRICHGLGEHFTYIEEWDIKRQYLAVYIQDIPNLVTDYKNSSKKLYELNPEITIFDQVPRLRLASACEAASNCLYSMAEISAQFGNKVSNGILPSSFNKFRKKYEQGSYSEIGIEKWCTNFEWYRKIRELRTEWVHFSTIFISEDSNKNPILIVRDYRRSSDKEEFKNKLNFKVDDLVVWINQAVNTIDNFGNFLLVKYILPSLDLNKTFISPVYDKNGFPLIKNGKILESEKITVKEHLRRCGIIFNR